MFQYIKMLLIRKWYVTLGYFERKEIYKFIYEYYQTNRQHPRKERKLKAMKPLKIEETKPDTQDSWYDRPTIKKTREELTGKKRKTYKRTSYKGMPLYTDIFSKMNVGDTRIFKGKKLSAMYVAVSKARLELQPKDFKAYSIGGDLVEVKRTY